jgi:hypothetical protein
MSARKAPRLYEPPPESVVVAPCLLNVEPKWSCVTPRVVVWLASE